MTQTVGMGDIIWQIVKGIPWWCWIIILISAVASPTTRRRYKRRRYYSNYNKSLFDEITDSMVNFILNCFKRNFSVKRQTFSQTYATNSTQQSTMNQESSIWEIDQMTGREFEKYLEKLFIKLGYKVNRVGTCWYDHRGDFGADLIVEKDEIKTAIQAKNYKNNNLVGINSVREVIGGLSHYNCQKAAVITNSYFTNDAKVQAGDSNVKLLNRDDLIKLISRTEIK